MKEANHLNRKVVSTLTIILLLVLLSFSWLFWRSQTRIQQAEAEAIKLVEYDYPVKKVNKFYWTTINKAYFSLDFVSDDNVQRYAIITREGGATAYYTPEQIISETDAISIAKSDVEPHKVLHARLGMLNESPVWEITIKNGDGTLTYYYLNATNGEWVQKIENI